RTLLQLLRTLPLLLRYDEAPPARTICLEIHVPHGCVPLPCRREAIRGDAVECGTDHELPVFGDIDLGLYTFRNEHVLIGDEPIDLRTCSLRSSLQLADVYPLLVYRGRNTLVQ